MSVRTQAAQCPSPLRSAQKISGRLSRRSESAHTILGGGVGGVCALDGSRSDSGGAKRAPWRTAADVRVVHSGTLTSGRLNRNKLCP